MSTFSGNLTNEEEDGGGWSGLVPTAQERVEEVARALLEERRKERIAKLRQ